MNKIKNWIHIKLISFLKIDTLINILDNYIDENNNTFTELRKLIYNLNQNTYKNLKNDISHFQESVNTLHKTVENVVHVGTDVHRENTDHSWAVVCIEGKINIVKFVSLDRKNGREILDFLKHFEAGKHCIDAPYKEIFYNELFKF
jgi:hypothetical protein